MRLGYQRVPYVCCPTRLCAPIAPFLANSSPREIMRFKRAPFGEPVFLAAKMALENPLKVVLQNGYQRHKTPLAIAQLKTQQK